MCHSIPVKSVENDKVAGSCLSEPLNEDHQQSQETTAEEEEAAAARGEDSGAHCDKAASGETERDKDVAETDGKDSGETQNVPEQTVETENESAQAGSVSEQGIGGESVDSETGSKKGEDDEKTEEEKAAADSSSSVKESSALEGDDQKKRFVAFCLLETQNGYHCCIGSFVLANVDALLKVTLLCAFVCSICPSSHSPVPL